MGNIIHLDAKPEASCGFHRIAMPYSRLNCRPRRPVFIFNRVPSGGIKEIVARKSIGFAIVADLDDSWLLDTDHYLSALLAHQRELLPQIVALADAVTVATAPLADLVRPYNENVVVIPNALPFDEDQFTLDTSTELSGVVYAAGPSHREDFRILAHAGVGPELYLAGFQERHPEWSEMRGMAPAISRIYKQPLPDYMHVYDGRVAALAPLRATPFNSCKSNLKVLEAGAKGKPLIVSPVDPYVSEVDSPFLDYARTSRDWRAAIDRMLSDRDYARERGAALAAHVRATYDLKGANRLRRKVLESL